MSFTRYDNRDLILIATALKMANMQKIEDFSNVSSLNNNEKVKIALFFDESNKEKLSPQIFSSSKNPGYRHTDFITLEGQLNAGTYPIKTTIEFMICLMIGGSIGEANNEEYWLKEQFLKKQRKKLKMHQHA